MNDLSQLSGKELQEKLTWELLILLKNAGAV